MFNLSGTTGNRSDQLYEFSDAQKWCKVSGKRIRFIDETADINSIHNEDFESDDDIISDEESPPSPPKPTQRAIREDTNNVAYSSQRNGKTPETNAKRLGEGDALPIERGQPYPLIKLPALHPHPTFHSPDSLGHLSIDEPPQTFSPAPRSQLSGPIGSISSIGSNSWSEDPSLPEPRRSFHTTNFPLKDYREANLIRYFIEVIAPFFDCGDPRDRFRTLLPQQAAKSPLLLNAVLAIAAKSKDVDGSLAFFDKPAEHYYGEALNLLQPFLGSLAQEVDDHQVTAAVLLRLYHSIEVFSADTQHFIVSSSISELLASRASLIPKGGLAEAALWGWIRLEVFRAVMQQEVLDLSLDRLELDRSVEPADDETWMWRMVLHSIDILRYCFGAKGSSATYEKLSAYAARWMRSVPETFLPIYFNPSTGNAPFPEVLFLTESVVVGLQFYHLNRILLMAHNPNMPRLGKNQKLAARALDVRIGPYTDCAFRIFDLIQPYTCRTR
ncbi:arca-like protein [Colletotrichum truncatum]|uniref:Arca-like protein n=1 Tax=Colletotrichum truncatum TaxID=5467 RepID=A0ACC3YJU1_COLTU